MERHLLFDSQCHFCSQVAHDIIIESGGLLEARSLRDPAIKNLLIKANPNWRWEPMLLEIEDEQVRVFTQTRMALRLARRLGLRRAWRTVRIVQKSVTPPFRLSPERRHLLGSVGKMLAGLTLAWLPLNRGAAQAQEGSSNTVFLPLVQNAGTNNTSTANELYAGFLLLSEGTPVPASVSQPALAIPIVCGVGGTVTTAIGESFSSLEAVVSSSKIPTYSLSNSFSKFEWVDGHVLKHETGEVFGSMHIFGTLNLQTRKWEKRFHIWSQPDFPRPFPLWSSEPVEPDGPAVLLEKVDFLPAPGVRVATRMGSVFHWIENDIFYTMTVEDDQSFEEAEALASSLVLG
jgi:predicted DCC family thiol-disulfide oxidoreductase YuxK